PLEPDDEAPQTSLTDHARKIVISRLGDRLRVAGTAELNGYDTEMNEPRCAALVKRCFEWFPKAGRPERAQFWTGLRPATPSNLPLIGRSKYSNLFLNTGHGTLGWTLACGSGRALADIVSGRKPEPEFGFLGFEAKRKGQPSRSPRAQPADAPRLLHATRGALFRCYQPGLGHGVHGEFAHEIRQREQRLMGGAVVVLQMAETAVADSNIDLRAIDGRDVGRVRAGAHRPQAAVQGDEHRVGP